MHNNIKATLRQKKASRPSKVSLDLNVVLNNKVSYCFLAIASLTLFCNQFRKVQLLRFREISLNQLVRNRLTQTAAQLIFPLMTESEQNRLEQKGIVVGNKERQLVMPSLSNLHIGEGQVGQRNRYQDYTQVALQPSRYLLQASWLASAFIRSISKLKRWSEAMSSLLISEQPMRMYFNDLSIFITAFLFLFTQ